jgi:flagellar biosynthesis protein FlhG
MATIISIASGKGGVGKSMVAANLAVMTARRGLRVALIDLDVGGADAHVIFGLHHPERTLTDFLQNRTRKLDAVGQSLPGFDGLRVFAGTGETLRTANPTQATRRRLLRQIAQLDADLAVIDVGAGTGLTAIDFFLTAEVQIAVATPDRLAVTDLVRFLKLASVRQVALALTGYKDVASAIAARSFASLPELLAFAGERSETARAIAEAALGALHPSLVLNRAREGSRLAQLRLTQLASDYLDREFPLLGAIPEDDAVRQSIAASMPVVDFAPSGPAALALQDVAAALLSSLGVAALRPFTRAAAAS